MLFCLVFGILFLVFGLLFFFGKALRWVSGWQAMPEAERAAVNIGPLCRNIGCAICAAGLILLAGAAWEAFRESWMQGVMVVWLVLCGVDVLYIGKSGRYAAGGKTAKK